jgi:hypothetical protein
MEGIGGFSLCPSEIAFGDGCDRPKLFRRIVRVETAILQGIVMLCAGWDDDTHVQ